MNTNFKVKESTLHTMDILRAAVPHLNSPVKQSIELMLKTEELMESASSLNSDGPLSACGSSSEEPVDMEALLLHVQEVCNSSEKETINMILNFIKAKKLYQTYQGYRSQFSGSLPDSSGSSASMMEFMMSQLPPEQKGTFDNLSMIFNTMNLNPGA